MWALKTLFCEMGTKHSNIFQEPNLAKATFPRISFLGVGAQGQETLGLNLNLQKLGG